MKTSSAELKRTAREHLQGNYPIMIGATVVSGLIPTLILIPFALITSINLTPSNAVIYYAAVLLVSFITTLFTLGLLRMHVMLARSEKPVFKDLFFCFCNRPDRFILETLLILAILVLIMLPAILIYIASIVLQNIFLMVICLFVMIICYIPMIIFMLSSNFALILLAEDDELTVVGALKESRRLMKGNKGRLFYISLCFLGWQFLNLLTLGIGSLWITPYTYQTQAEFYLDITNPHDE